MKFTIGSNLIALLLVTGVALVSCKSKNSDADIKAAIDQKVQSNAEMKTLNASVLDGVVTLTGSCKDEDCRKSCEDKVEDVKGVKKVINNIDIATPAATSTIQITGDDQLRTGVNDVLKSYKTVQADVNDGIITLRGEVKRDELQNLLMSVNELKPKKIDNQLAIK